jgi:hypothetical protein
VTFAVSPRIDCSSIDLPLPTGPTTATSSPRLTRRSIPAMWKPVYPWFHYSMFRRGNADQQNITALPKQHIKMHARIRLKIQNKHITNKPIDWEN